MTKYILNSGNVSNNFKKARKFFTEVVKGLGTKPKILLCLFSSSREEWEEKYAKDLKILPDFFETGVAPSFDLAFPDSFKKQLKECDAVYIHGGDDHLVQYWLKQFEVPKIWEGKVIATSSSGSNAMSKEFWTCDWRTCMDGFGFLPIKFIAHYKSGFGSNDP